MEINWDAMTALSTLSMTIATLAVAIIALQAKNTWKNEIREKKKYDLIREMKIKLTLLTSDVVQQIHFLFPNLTSENEEIKNIYIDIAKNTLNYLSENFGRLSVIKQELDYLKCKKISNELNRMLNIIEMPPFCPNLSKLAISNLHEKENIYLENIYKLNKDEINHLNNKIQKMCDDEIDKFYNH